MSYEAFLSFEELGLQDYIFELDWSIKARSFSLDRYTIGDLLDSNISSLKQNLEIRLFKNIFQKDIQELAENLNHQEISLDDKYVREKIENEHIEKKNFFQTFTNKSYYELRKDILNLNKVAQENFNDVQNFINNHFEHNGKVSNISETNNVYVNENLVENIIQNKFNQSNNYTEQEIIRLEQNLNAFIQQNSNNSTYNLTKLEQKIIANHENSTKHLKEEIRDTRSFLEDFLSK